MIECRLVLAGHLTSVVGRAVIHDADLVGLSGLANHRFKCVSEKLRLIIAGDGYSDRAASALLSAPGVRLRQLTGFHHAVSPSAGHFRAKSRPGENVRPRPAMESVCWSSAGRPPSLPSSNWPARPDGLGRGRRRLSTRKAT